MLKINENNRISGIDIYNFVEVKTRYYDWIRRCIDYADLKNGIDFLTYKLESTGGREKTIFEFTIEAAKEICIVSATSKAKELRRWLISLSNKRENLDLLTHDEVIRLNLLKRIFCYIENQKEILKDHVNKFVSDHDKSINPYAEFNIWRNKLLEIDANKLDMMIKNYCIENSKRIPNIKTNFDKVYFLNEYDSIRNAVFDFLSIKGEVNALKLANLVKRMAESENLVVNLKNENNLFQKKENVSLKQLK